MMVIFSRWLNRTIKVPRSSAVVREDRNPSVPFLVDSLRYQAELPILVRGLASFGGCVRMTFWASL